VLGAVLHGNGCCWVGEKISSLCGHRPPQQQATRGWFTWCVYSRR